MTFIKLKVIGQVKKDHSVEELIEGGSGGDVKGLLKKVTVTGSTKFVGEITEDGNLVSTSNNSNTNYNLTIPKAPRDYVVPPLKYDEPVFDQVESPDDWDSYFFQPTKFMKAKMYSGQFLPHRCKTYS